MIFLCYKVDIVQMSVLEFKERTGRPYYHLERFIVRINNHYYISVISMDVLGWKLHQI